MGRWAESETKLMYVDSNEGGDGVGLIYALYCLRNPPPKVLLIYALFRVMY